jgi:hypothetical protein
MNCINMVDRMRNAGQRTVTLDVTVPCHRPYPCHPVPLKRVILSCGEGSPQMPGEILHSPGSLNNAKGNG